jgi:hypothetical protein
MAAITYRGAFDESGDGDDPVHSCASIGGYVGSVDSWDRFEIEWQRLLDEFSIPYLHIKEFGTPKGPYADLVSDPPRMATMFARFVEVIGSSDLTAFAAVVRIPDLQTFNRDCGQNIEWYPLALHHCLGEIALQYPDVMMDLAVDRIPYPHRKIAKALEYMAAQPLHPECYEAAKNFRIAPLPKGLTFKNVRALQAADFLTWEARKSIHMKADYFASLKPNRTQDEWDRDLILWLVRDQLKGEVTVYNPGSSVGEVRQLPIGERKSYASLIEKSPIKGGILDYHYMSSQNQLRGGIWSYPAAVEG